MAAVKVEQNVTGHIEELYSCSCFVSSERKAVYTLSPTISASAQTISHLEPPDLKEKGGRIEARLREMMADSKPAALEMFDSIILDKTKDDSYLRLWYLRLWQALDDAKRHLGYYDMPWNPMRVEQRIGRIDRLGQQHESVRIINLHYEGTVEADVYRALRNRIGLFESVVGRLQPILAQVPQRISQTVLSGRDRDDRERATVVDTIEQQAREAMEGGFDIDTVTEQDFAMSARLSSSITMEDLDRIIGDTDLMPSETDVQPMGHREYGLLLPDMTERLRVTTDPMYFAENAESLEFWSPGNMLFTPPGFTTRTDDPPTDKTLKDILDG